MSRSFGLVKFKSTGNVYYCMYNGTSDIMNPHLCTASECYDKETDGYWAITYCERLTDQKGWRFPEDVADLDEIEIYSDYGGGFYWNGTGSESARMIKDYLNPFDEVWPNITDGTPEWVDTFLEELNNKNDELQRL